MRIPRGGRVVATAAVLLLAASGCTGTTGSKTGGQAAPVVLTLADGYSDPVFEPAIARFAARVAAVSAGRLTIRSVRDWGGFQPDAEQRIVADVAAGKADLGWTGTRVFDTLGVHAFDALTAPMLIDGYPLENAVITSDIPTRMLRGLAPLHVTGLAVLGSDLRKPVSKDRALVSVADFHGITMEAFRSASAAAAIRALGATPTDDASGTYSALERGLRMYAHNYASGYPYVAANVNLWPETLALFANPARLGRLSAEQRGWLTTAAKDTAAASSALNDGSDGDQAVVDATCTSGSHYVDASAADLTALRTAFDGVYTGLERDAATKAFLEQIEALKAKTATGTPLVIPATCGQAASGDAVRGVWQSASLTEGQIVQAFVAAGGGEADGHAFFAQLGGGAEHAVRFRVEYDNGGVTEFESADGRAFTRADNRSFTVDGTTMTTTEEQCTTTYRIAATATTLRLAPIAQCKDDDGPYSTTIYGSFPFTRVS